jgi:16S rRNA (cytosine967-C5)-methyltransferase
VLRNAARRKAELLHLATEQEISVRYSHPRFLVERWVKNFGAEKTEALCRWNNQPALVYARINQLKISASEFTRQHPNVERLLTPANFVRLTSIPNEALATGDCYIQDPSTAHACLLLDPQPGERIGDACAAPGGKTGYIAEIMKNEGFILACDRDPGRIETLRDNLSRLGITIAECRQQDWTSDSLPPGLDPFDRILIDAPCSNTGVMRRRADLRWRLRPEDFSRMPEQQLRIARATIPLLKPGGTLLYSTCSLEPEENEEVVRQILREFPLLKLVEEVSVLPFRDGFDGAYAAKLVRA